MNVLKSLVALAVFTLVSAKRIHDSLTWYIYSLKGGIWSLRSMVRLFYLIDRLFYNVIRTFHEQKQGRYVLMCITHSLRQEARKKARFTSSFTLKLWNNLKSYKIE